MSEKNPLENPNVQKFLDFLGKAEGADYDVIVGGKKFDDFSKHPRIVGLRTKEGPSTAAGKYQITKTTYDDFAPKLGITDFSPNSQDRLAVAIFQKEKALADIEKGDFNAAISKLGGRFASLPSSPYSQPKRSQDFVDMQLGMALGEVSTGPSRTQKVASSARKPQFDVAAGPKKAPAKGKLALSDLPESYRSALALNFLVDSDPEDELMAKATQLLQASMPEQGGGPAGGKVLQQFAAQMPEVSPYQFLQPSPPDPGPVKMATGGLAIGGTNLPFIPGPSLTQEQMDLIKQREQQYEQYQQRYKEYEPQFKEYETQADAFNRAVEEHNKLGVQYSSVVRDAQGNPVMFEPLLDMRGPYEFRTALFDPTNIFNRQYKPRLAPLPVNTEYGETLQFPGYAAGQYYHRISPSSNVRYVQQRTVRDPSTSRDIGQGYLVQAYDGKLTDSPNFTRTAFPGEFTQKSPVAPTAPELGFDSAQHEKFVEQAQKDAGLRAQALQIASDPGRFNLSGLAAFGAAESPNPVVGRRPGIIPRLPRMFEKGGEVTGDDLFQQMITGRVVEPVAEPVVMPRPVQSEVPSMDRLTGGVMRDQPQVKPQRTVLQEIVGGLEAGATIATGIPAMVPAAARGVMGFLTPGEKLADTGTAMMDVAQKLTYAPKGEAGQENLENLGQFLQATKLDAMLPQVQLMRPLIAPGAVGILRQQAKDAMDVRGGPGGAPPMSGMGLQPAMAAVGQGPVDRTAADRPLVRPAEGVAMPSITQATQSGEGKRKVPDIDRSSILPSEKTPLVSELERRVADLPGPVQKEQFINTIKNNSRDYELRRVEEALAEFGPKDKLTPNQIMSALKRTSPSRYNLQILPAENRSGFSRKYDNPYPTRPIGSVNLLLEPQEAQRRVSKLYDDIQEFRHSEPTLKIFGQSPTFIDDYVRKVNNFADQVEEFDAQLSTKVKREAGKVASEARPILDLQQSRNYAKNPQLDPENKWLVNWNEKTVPQEVKNLLRSRGVNTLTPELTLMAVKELATIKYLKELKNQVDAKSGYGYFTQRIMTDYEKNLLNDLASSSDPIPDKTFGSKGYYQEVEDIQRGKLLLGDSPDKDSYTKEIQRQFASELNSVLEPFDYPLAKTRMEVIQDVRNLSQRMLDSDTLLSGRIYQGTHTGIVNQNPISFSRFVEVNPSDIVNPPANMQPGKGLLFTELQSDRRSAIQDKRKGSVEEPYPGFAEDPDTLSELMMKSAVAGASQLNKKLVLFPGSDSEQPQLYGTWATEEAKKAKDMSQYSPSIMKRVSRKVAKDLGKGYEAREFKTINGKGEEITRWGIVFPDDTSELTKKGIRFAKGGLVGNPLYDRL